MDKSIPFSEMLRNIDHADPEAWLYLPSNAPWTLQSLCIALKSEPVSKEEELQENAGVPAYGRNNDLMQTLSVREAQGVIENLKSQQINYGNEDLLKAFLYFYDNDAFIDMDNQGDAPFT